MYLSIYLYLFIYIKVGSGSRSGRFKSESVGSESVASRSGLLPSFFFVLVKARWLPRCRSESVQGRVGPNDFPPLPAALLEYNGSMHLYCIFNGAGQLAGEGWEGQTYSLFIWGEGWWRKCKVMHV